MFGFLYVYQYLKSEFAGISNSTKSFKLFKLTLDQYLSDPVWPGVHNTQWSATFRYLDTGSSHAPCLGLIDSLDASGLRDWMGWEEVVRGMGYVEMGF